MSSLFILLSLATFMPVVVNSQVTTASSCGCTSYTSIGTTGEKTSATGISFNSSTCYFIKGILQVEEPTTFWTDLRFKMEEGAKIAVSGNLSIDDCYISGCGDMWVGIETEGEVNLFVYNSFIQGANIAIRIGTHAGIVFKYNEFVDNYIGVAVGSPLEADIFDQEIQRGELWGNKFYTNSFVPDPYPGHYYYPSWPTTPSQIPYNQGYAAIYLSGLAGLNIGYVDADVSDRNLIYQMRNGIVLRNTVANISGTDFYDFEGNIPGSVDDPVADLNQHAINMYRSVTNIEDNTFDNLMVGIYGEESFNTIHDNEITLSTPTPGFGFTRGISLLRPQTATVTNNLVNEGMRGISVEDVTNDFLIKGNELDRDYNFGGVNIGIFVRNAKLDPAVGVIQGNVLSIDDGSVSNGIHLIRVNHLLVTNNSIDYINGSEHQTRGILGVDTYNSFIKNNTISAEPEYMFFGNNGIEITNSGFNTAFCNSMDNFWINLHVFGLNLQTKLVTNVLEDAEFGFGLTSPAMIGTQKHHGNQWNGTYGDLEASIFGTTPLFEAMTSTFFVDLAEDPDFMPNPVFPTTVWFIDNNGPGTKTCLINEPNPVADPDTLSKILLTELEFEHFNEETSWGVKADIFYEMLLDPSLASNGTLDSFFDVELPNPLGKLIKWHNDLCSRFGVQRTDKLLTQDTIFNLSDDIVYIDSIVALNPVNLNTWLALRELKVDTLVKEFAEWNVMLTTEETDSQAEYTEIADDLDNLTPTNDLETYLRAALLFKTQYLLRSGFSSGDSTDIVDLATLCPWEGGRAMSVGQELYSTIMNNLVLPTTDNCPSPSPLIQPNVSTPNYEGEIFTVYPNPFSNKIEVVAESRMLEIVLRDINMRTIAVFKPMQKYFTIFTGDLLPGTYLLSATTEVGKFTNQIMHIK